MRRWFEATLPAVEQAGRCPSPGERDQRSRREARRSDPDVEAAWQDRLAARLNICRAIITMLAKDPGLKSGLGQSAAVDLMWTLTSLRMWEDLVLGRNWSARQYEKEILALLQRALLA